MSEEEQWIDAAVAIYNRIAPSYVKASTSLDRLTLRNLYHEGATLQQFEEALAHAYSRTDVTKRNAFRYAVGIVRHQLREPR